jgi:glutaredoxin/uncharacterized protein (DUF302 family)
MLKLYQAEWCPQCHMVRQALTELGLPFEARQVAEDPEQRSEVAELSGQKSVPVLVDGETVLSGSVEIVDYLRTTYPPAPDADEHAARGFWRATGLSSLPAAETLDRLKALLVEHGFEVVAEIPGPRISERLPESYVLLQASVPVAAVKSIEIDPTAVSGVLLPLAVFPVENGSAVVAADPVGQVWLFADPELRKVQGAVKKRLAEVFAEL